MAREQEGLTLLFAHLQNSPSLPCWVWPRAGALYTPVCKPREGGLRAEALWKLWGQGYPPEKVLQIQRKRDKERQGHGCGHFPSGHPGGGCRVSRRTESYCRASLLQPPSVGSSDGDRHWFPLQGHTWAPSSHLWLPNPTSWTSAGAQARLHSSWEQWRYSFPSTDAVVNLLAM